MTCPHCNLKNTSEVIDSRMTVNLSGERKRRRRECRLCGGRFTTYEYVDLAPCRNIVYTGRPLGRKNKQPQKTNWLSRVLECLEQ